MAYKDCLYNNCKNLYNPLDSCTKVDSCPLTMVEKNCAKMAAAHGHKTPHGHPRSNLVQKKKLHDILTPAPSRTFKIEKPVVISHNIY